MAVDLPSNWKPSTESTSALIPNTRPDMSQDGTPFVRVMGPSRHRTSVVIKGLNDFDARQLLGWLMNNRTETINVPIDGEVHSGLLFSEPSRDWEDSNRSSVSFEIYG